MPHNQLFILIDEDKIWIGDEVIAEVADVMVAADEPIDGLAQVLEAHKESLGELSAYEKHNGLPVTILGDKTVSYTLLKRVMTTCQRSEFREISLAVNQIISNLPEGLGVAKSTAASAKAGG
jgi:hypothetical protein